MLQMPSTTDDEYTRSLSVTASTAYPVPVSATTTPAGGDVVEIGKVMGKRLKKKTAIIVNI